MKSKLPISAVMLAHQHSDLFKKVIHAVSWCDEIVVVVSEEAKELESFCKSVSAKVFYRKLDGFGPQKQFAISKASHDWILLIDSDELVTDELQKSIHSLYHSKAFEVFSAFRINRKLIFLNKPLTFSGTASRPIRLFNRANTKMNSSLVHEELESQGKIGYIKKPLFHFSYFSLEEYLSKFNRYTSLGAQELFQAGKKTNILFAYGRFLLLFVRRYILQLGFLDGSTGFTWCFLSALYSTIKYLKLRELQQTN